MTTQGTPAVRGSAAARRRLKAVTPYLLLLPAACLLGIFIYGIATGVLEGFGIMPFLGKTELTLDYWIEAFSISGVRDSLLFSLYISLISSLVAVVGGIILCAALTKVGAGQGLTIAGIQVPIMTAHVLVVLAFVSLFAGSGLFPRVLYLLGLISSPTDFPSIVGEPSGWGIILTYAWKEIPFIAFCTIDIMANASARYGEAAQTLGASPVTSFFRVTLPLCKGALLRAFLVVFAFAFGAYEVPFLLEPTLPKAFPVLAYIEFMDPDIANRCLAMAVNGIMVLITTAMAAVYYAVLKREGKLL